TVAHTLEQAAEALATPPANSGRVLLEELLEGEEASLQALVDGETVVALPPAIDHKRAHDGGTGPNTGGMGAFSPTLVLPDDRAQALAEELIAPIAAALAKRGTPYRGVLYAGLIKTADGWKVLEYNARFGDPEAEVTLPRVEGDFAKLLFALGEGRLAEYVAAEPIRFSKRHYVDVVLCAENYPGPPKTGMPVVGLDRLPENVLAFHGATKRNATGDVVVSGGRVMHIVASGDTIAEARDRAYAGAVAALTTLPVMGVPLVAPNAIAGGLDALLSTVQMPRGIPVATVAVGDAGAVNAGILAAEILATSDEPLGGRIKEMRRRNAA